MLKCGLSPQTWRDLFQSWKSLTFLSSRGQLLKLHRGYEVSNSVEFLRWYSVGKEIHCVLYNPKVHCPFTRVCHKITSYKPVHRLAPYLFKISFNISLSILRLGLSSGPFVSDFSTKFLYACLIFSVLYVPPNQPSKFDRAYKILWRVQIMKLLLA
jgi:hypothetical protein